LKICTLAGNTTSLVLQEVMRFNILEYIVFNILECAVYRNFVVCDYSGFYARDSCLSSTTSKYEGGAGRSAGGGAGNSAASGASGSLMKSPGNSGSSGSFRTREDPSFDFGSLVSICCLHLWLVQELMRPQNHLALS
jgi:hypothetical protein